MSTKKAGMERWRQMTDAPHAIRMQMEKTRTHMAILMSFSSSRDRPIVVAVVGCVTTTTVVLSGCGWGVYAS